MTDDALDVLRDLVTAYETPPAVRFLPDGEWKKQWDAAWDRARALLAAQAEPQAAPTAAPPDGYIYETDSYFGVHRSIESRGFNGRTPDRRVPYWLAAPAQESPECICPRCGIRHGGSNADAGF